MGDGDEFDAIRRLLAIWGDQAIGIGDDAAILDIPSGEQLVVSTDASIEDVHFRRDWLSAEEMGARATAAALSDLAAMAATPRGMLLALGLPIHWRSELEALARGVGTAALLARCPILGGNLSGASQLSLTITVLGSTSHPLTRAAACPGDTIFVTGTLGASHLALQALMAGRAPASNHRDRFAKPAPRLREAIWLAEHGAHAAIDISDGLLADVSHMARASCVSIKIDDDAIPCVPGASVEDALASGEEYELIVAAPRDAPIRPAEFKRAFGLDLTAIGTVGAVGTVPVTLSRERTGMPRGHDHFS